ncbi:hypothetical protein V8C37DRAFT_307335 [Trichoderma ceciliae]
MQVATSLVLSVLCAQLLLVSWPWRALFSCLLVLLRVMLPQMMMMLLVLLGSYSIRTKSTDGAWEEGAARHNREAATAGPCSCNGTSNGTQYVAQHVFVLPRMNKHVLPPPYLTPYQGHPSDISFDVDLASLAFIHCAKASLPVNLFSRLILLTHMRRCTTRHRRRPLCCSSQGRTAE